MEYTDTLNPARWTRLPEIPEVNAGTASLPDYGSIDYHSRRFYRVLILPKD